MDTVKKGAWVEIQQLILKPQDRAPTLPEDTRLTPLVLRVNGFLLADAKIGDEVIVRSLIGRELSGILRIDNPGYSHSFGVTVPELLSIGTGADR